jgi:hypothetical protein
VGYVACVGESRKGYRVLVGKIDGMRALGKPRHKWEYYIANIYTTMYPKYPSNEFGH